MRLAFIGFTDYIRIQEEITSIVEQAGHMITEDPEKAEMLFVPHHMEELFPTDMPWIAIWILGGRAKMLELNALANPPREIVYAAHWTDISQHPEFITDRII